MTDLLARFAECAFWMGRYMERAENLARVIDVNESFARDNRGPADWLPIVEINADTKRFFEKHDEATAEAVVAFYLRDGDNPISIVSAVRAARDNARMLRHLISTELWTHLNVFHNELSRLGPADLRLGRLSRLCMTIKERCQTHTGIAEGTLYRDQAWTFHEIGKQLERADQTTRLLDIKYHRLLPASEAVGSSIDAGQWNALLRSAAGYHAFRRAYPRGMHPRDRRRLPAVRPRLPALGRGLREPGDGRPRPTLDGARAGTRRARGRGGPGVARRFGGGRDRRGHRGRFARVPGFDPAPPDRDHRPDARRILRL